MSQEILKRLRDSTNWDKLRMVLLEADMLPMIAETIYEHFGPDYPITDWTEMFGEEGHVFLSHAEDKLFDAISTAATDGEQGEISEESSFIDQAAQEIVEAYVAANNEMDDFHFLYTVRIVDHDSGIIYFQYPED